MRTHPSLFAALSAGMLATGALAAPPATTPPADTKQAQSAPTPRVPAAPQATATTPAEVGKPAPDFTLEDETGTKHQLSQYRGKTVVLEWTNPDCPFVKRHYEADTMQKLYGSLKDVVWLTVDSTSTGSRERLVSFKKAEGLGWPLLQDKNGTVGRTYGAKTTPHMFVIDAEGKLRYAGAIDDDPRGKNASPTNYVRNAVQAVQNKRDPDPSSTTPYGCSVKYAH